MLRRDLADQLSNLRAERLSCPGGSGAGVGAGWDAEELQEVCLEGRELRLDGLQRVSVAG